MQKVYRILNTMVYNVGLYSPLMLKCYLTMIYYKENRNCFAESENFDVFYCKILKIVKENWNRTGNSILGLSDSKVSRLLSGKQKDFETLIKMAEFMKLSFSFKLY